MQYYKRNLPHFHPPGAMFFVTFSLHEAIPSEILITLRESYSMDILSLKRKYVSYQLYHDKLYSLQKIYFSKYDNILNSAAYGPVYLCNNEIAGILYDKIISFDSIKYDLITFTILPNHVHLVFMTYEKYVISDTNINGKTKNYFIADILRLIKGPTARHSNLILQRSGIFWHHESYDHVVRNIAELDRIVKYVTTDPVRAGLVCNSSDWKWTFSKLKSYSH